VLRNGVTQEFHHVEALKAAGGTALTTSYWLPDAAFDDGNVGLFSTLEFIDTVESGGRAAGALLLAPGNRASPSSGVRRSRRTKSAQPHCAS
jgi:hypothetical protein